MGPSIGRVFTKGYYVHLRSKEANGEKQLEREIHKPLHLGTWDNRTVMRHWRGIATLGREGADKKIMDRHTI